MDDTTRTIAFFALFLPGCSLCILDGFVMMAMIGEVNRRLTDGAQISYLGGHLMKTIEVLDKYKTFYPKGKLARIHRLVLIAAMILIALSAAVLFRFIR